MSEISWDYNTDIQVEGVLDTGIIVIAHHKNPIQKEMLDFLEEIISGKRRILIPLTAFVGAYHILTSYLKVSRYDAKSALTETLKLESPFYYPLVDKNTVIRAFDFSSIHNIESWDGYLIILAKNLQTSNIYTIDNKLRKIKEISVINPVSDEKLAEYHQWLKEKIGKEN
ncbi:MAG: type II toxin-antitoxin system VapC family toxin [Candidatus Hermodarchaeota archaeon]